MSRTLYFLTISYSNFYIANIAIIANILLYLPYLLSKKIA
ncbi:hypothetical protein H1P_2910004 [Hyella patelloides LEGE 07179]|uniref:Uncharacterized protein n=1 Tax=Hyella patelloides LEGE 07179 TaxID=945734 RepID=A0A563VTW0_9CYAN|nr:hypothetical protein H1P_2910004 [Hyella patelloides LEGE 07179]